MKTFKVYLEERNLFTTGLASLAVAASAMGGQTTKPEALEIATNHIKGFESFQPKTYVDQHATGKPLAIGYGITRTYPDGTEVKMSDTVTEPEAHNHLKQHIDKHVLPKLEKIPNWKEMSPHQQASLIGFAYNTGGGFYGSKGYETISSHLKNKEWDKVDDAMKLYNKSGGKVLGGLVRRRGVEADMWSKGTTSTQPVVQQTPPIASPNVHIVGKGDNLTKIAEKRKTTVQELLKKNPELKSNPDRITPGQKIKY